MKATKGKKFCGQKATKLLDKPSVSNLTFTPIYEKPANFTQTEDLLESIDGDIRLHFRRLDKKDSVTKLKSINEIMKYLNETTDDDTCTNSIQYWSNNYGKLCNDDNKEIRELTQKIMQIYASKCGKNLSQYLKKILPSWISAQSDFHKPAADIALQSFKETFTDDSKRTKAYFLFWGLIYNNIKTAIIDTQIKSYPNEVVYSENIGVQIRTLMAMLPYFDVQDKPIKDVKDLLKDKRFWLHLDNNNSLVTRIYLQFSLELLEYLPEISKDKTICQHVLVCFRMINNDSDNTLEIWQCIEKCLQVYENEIWTMVSFKSVVLPKFLKLLETGLNYQLSNIVSYILVLIRKFPLNFSSSDHDKLIIKLLNAIVGLFKNPQICNHLSDSTAISSLFGGTNIFIMFSAWKFKNDHIYNFCWNNTMQTCQSYLIGDINLRSDNFTKIFAEVILKNVYIKKLSTLDLFIDNFLQFLELHYKNELFCERMTQLFKDLTTINDNNEFNMFKIKFFNKLVNKLHEKSLLSNGEFCLIPYFYLNSYENSENIKQVDSFSDFWINCQILIQEYDNMLFYQIISDGLSFLLNNIDDDKKLDNYKQFFEPLSHSVRYVFFEHFYLLFFNKLDKNCQQLVSEYTTNIWVFDLKSELNSLINHYKSFSSKEIKILFKIFPKSPMHQIYYKHLINNLTSITEQAFSTTISLEIAENLILFISNVLKFFKTQSNLSMVPYNLIKMLLRLLICNDESDCHDLGLAVLKDCIEYYSITDNTDNNLNLLCYLMSSPCYNDINLQANLMNILVSNDENDRILTSLKLNLVTDLNELERSYSLRWKYTKFWSNNNMENVQTLLHNMCLLIKMLQINKDNSFIDRFPDFKMIGLLLSSVLTDKVFCSCEQSNMLLEKCDLLLNYLTQIDVISEFDDILKGFCDTNSKHFYANYPCLLVKWLNLYIPIEYSKWSSTTKCIMTDLTENWCVDDIKKFWITINFAFPKSIEGRFLVKDNVLAQLTSYVNAQNNETLTITQINKSLYIMCTLISYDIDYYTSCFPLLLEMKSNFQTYFNDLQPGYGSCYPSTDYFELTPLLQLLNNVMEVLTGNLLESNCWEFVLCLVASLIRSDQFKKCTDYMKDPIDSNKNSDKLVSGYWLLKIVTNIAINISSGTENENLLDEWENFFSENLFREILDQFSSIAGSYEKQGKLVCHELFQLYCEQLCNAVSVCPVNVLNNYSFPVYINLDDPIELPKDCLEKMNYFLESLSNYNLSVQMASYNCLVNISEQLRDFLNNEVNKVESSDGIDSFKLTLPMKLVNYLECPKLKTDCDLESISYRIQLTRYFLSWHLILELVRLSAPKLRAELTQFLQQYYNKFLTFCFSFMPQNPIIVKNRFGFLVRYNESKSKINLIRQAPKSFDQCIGARSTFQLLHLACYLFGKCVETLPSLTRIWWLVLQNKSQIAVEEYVRRYITPEIFRREFRQLEEENTIQNKRIVYASAYQANDDERRMEISTIPMLGEVTVRYYFNEDQFVEQLIQLPQNYPLGMVHVKLKKEFNPIRDNKWRAWNIQITATMQNQNGTFLDGVRLLKNQLDSYMSGIEECMVCYSILHATKYTLPNTRCKQCKKKYHKDCLYKWFESSPSPSCPNCRHLFFDGTYRSNFRRPVVPNQPDNMFDNFNGDRIQFIDINDLM